MKKNEFVKDTGMRDNKAISWPQFNCASWECANRPVRPFMSAGKRGFGSFERATLTREASFAPNLFPSTKGVKDHAHEVAALEPGQAMHADLTVDSL